MITIEILDELHNLIFESSNDCLNLCKRQLPWSSRKVKLLGPYLFMSGDEFNHLLQSAGSMLIKRNLDHLRSSVVNEDRTLFIIREFQQFLTEIVAKGV